MAQRIGVAGELYFDLDGQLHEIKRQLRQQSGYPFDPERLKAALQEIIEGKFLPEVHGSAPAPVFRLMVEGTHKTSELIALGKYDWFNDWITDERFPLELHAPVERTIEYIMFAHDPESEEVLTEFTRRGLEHPTYEDALYFGVQYPEEQRKASLVWLHEPVQGPNGDRGVLVSHEYARRRRLHLLWFGHRWDRYSVFPAARK